MLTVFITVCIVNVQWETILGQKSIILVQREKKKKGKEKGVLISLLRQGTSGIAE